MCEKYHKLPDEIGEIALQDAGDLMDGFENMLKRERKTFDQQRWAGLSDKQRETYLRLKRQTEAMARETRECKQWPAD